MNGEIIASGLEFPEGPVWLDGTIWFTEILGGHVSRWTPDGGVERVADTGGGPNGATAAADGSLYVTQNGGMGTGGRTTPGIQRVTTDGTVDDRRHRGRRRAPRRAQRPRLRARRAAVVHRPARRLRPGEELAARDASSPSTSATGEGEMVIELGPVFPNGIAFLGDGTLVWSESFSRRVMRLVDGTPEVVIELPELHFPDGFCVGADGRAVRRHRRTPTASASSTDGAIVDKLPCADGMVTNCCFGGARTDLYVTDSRNGTLWRYDARRRRPAPPHRALNASGPVVAAHRQRGEHGEQAGATTRSTQPIGAGVDVAVHQAA